MKKLIRDIIDEIDAFPGLPHWEFAVRRYAVDMLKDYMSRKGLTIWDKAERISRITEKDLFNGAKDWQQYSLDGNCIIWTEDVSMRLFGQKSSPISPDSLFDLQGKALQQAAQLILQAMAQTGIDACPIRDRHDTGGLPRPPIHL